MEMVEVDQHPSSSKRCNLGILTDLRLGKIITILRKKKKKKELRIFRLQIIQAENHRFAHFVLVRTKQLFAHSSCHTCSGLPSANTLAKNCKWAKHSFLNIKQGEEPSSTIGRKCFWLI